MQKLSLRSLRRHRRATGLSQAEVAFLLGSSSGIKVSRYEQENRFPSLPTTLALEIILQAPANKLYPHLRQSVEQQVAPRLSLLITELTGRHGAEHKLAHLMATMADLTHIKDAV